MSAQFPLATSSWDDAEFALDGPASAQILEAWEGRLQRMKFPKEYFGAERLQHLQAEFLQCLASSEHRSTTRLTLIIARKK